jgi:hypothetical protein
MAPLRLESMFNNHMQYRYPHFKREILIEDLSFHGGPYPGQQLPDFDLPTTDGNRIRKRDFVGQRPLLFTLASITCPMAMSAIPALKRLHTDFGDRVAFVTLYVREAHPGERFPQPETFEEKFRHAQVYKERTKIPWPIAVDSLEGDLHRALDPRPNAAYLMDVHGNVAFRALCSNLEQVLRQGLDAIVSTQPLPIGQNEAVAIPMVKGMGMMDEVLNLAGEEAKQDLLRELPTVYLLVRLAAWFRPLPPLGRGVAALATSVLGMIAVLGGLGWQLKRQS